MQHFFKGLQLKKLNFNLGPFFWAFITEFEKCSSIIEDVVR